MKMHRIYKLINRYTILLLLLFSTVNANAYEFTFEDRVRPEIVGLIQISFSDPSFDFNEFVRQISNKNSLNLTDADKKNIKGSVFFEKTKHRCNANIKINGDWKDHIDPVLGIASLNINLLEDCSVDGISKFKLLLPETRNGENEIFFNLLLESFGFPALYTTMVDVSLGNIKYKALFQEKFSTYFLERHGIRESPIIEQDERAYWFNVEHFSKMLKDGSHRKINDVFAPDGFTILDGSLSRSVDTTYGRLVNKEMINKEDNIPIIMRALSEFRSDKANIINGEFLNELYARYAPHAFGSNTRVYIPFLNSWVPLYYDGNVMINESEFCPYDTEGPSKDFELKYKMRSKMQLTAQMECVFKGANHISKLYPISWNFSNHIKNKNNPIEYSSPSNGSLALGINSLRTPFVYGNNDKYYLVNNDKSSKISMKQLAKFLRGSSVRLAGLDIPVVVYGLVNTETNVVGYQYTTSNPDISIVDHVGYVFFNDSLNDKKQVKIRLNGKGARAVLFGPINHADQITVSGNSSNSVESRHDSLMLTGCLTVLGSSINGGNISSTVEGCEDSVNIYSAKGKLDTVSVENSTQDALDMDFSTLDISEIQVNNSGNDCIDVSAGNYKFGKGNLKSCKDKAFSIGEGSVVKIKEFYIEDSENGVVVKDGSIAEIDFLSARNIKNKCLTSAVKKSRYKNPIVFSNTIVCN